VKILHVVQIHWYNAEVQYAYDLAELQAKRGHEIHVLTRVDSLSAKKARERGFKVFVEDGFNAKGLGFFKAFSAGMRFRLHLDRERYDVVLIHRSEGLLFLAAACKKEGVPAIRVRGDMRPVRTDPLNRAVYRDILSAVVAVNATIAGRLATALGPRARVRVIHGGVDANAFTPEGEVDDLRVELGLPPDAFLVGLVGRMARHKGFADAIEAARLVRQKRPEVHLILLVKNDYPLFEDLVRKVSDDPLLASGVHVLGQRENLPATLRAFDAALVVSTESEANCRVGLEWMASGIALLATSVGVLPDIVAEGVTGMLLPPGDPERMAEALLALAADREKCAEMGREARHAVLRRLTLERTADDFERLFREILSDLPR